MTIALYISLVLNYLFIAGVVLLWTADLGVSHAAWTDIALLWPVTVPMLFVRRAVRRGR